MKLVGKTSWAKGTLLVTFMYIMKIKSFKNINGWRWIGFALAMISVSILSNANISTQWVGWKTF